MRLFIAIDLDNTLKEKIYNIIEKLKTADCSIKWVEKENLHITLKFIGETPEDKIESIKKTILKAIDGIKKFKLSISGFGVFLNMKFPRVLWLGVKEGENQLKTIAERLSPSEKNFSCHLTIGRFKSTKNLEKLTDILKKLQLDFIGETEVSQVVLFQSKLTGSGPIYTPLEKFDLC